MDYEMPFPRRQLTILALCRICEPIAFMSIFPYVYQMVRTFRITEDESQVAIYAGLITSSFTFAEFLSSSLWGRLSDRVGRKPVLLAGLAGTGISMLVFGFASSLQVALIARALGGLLNGNIGVLQSTLGELPLRKCDRPRAYSIMPFVWSMGSIIGSGAGGLLAYPASSMPSVFSPGSLFDRYPFLLSNLICTFMVMVGLVIGILFLEETHPDRKGRRDYGLEVGVWLLRLGNTRPPIRLEKPENGEETESFLPKHAVLESSPRISDASLSDRSISSGEGPSTNTLIDLDLESSPASKIAASHGAKVRSTQIILNIVGYGVLAFHTIALEQLVPILFSEPLLIGRVSLPFLFTGGLNYTTQRIGLILACQGVLQMTVQICLFPLVSKRFGSLKLFRATIAIYPLLYFAAPYLALSPPLLRLVFIAVMLFVKRIRGRLNGTAASSASLGRALGPTIIGIIHTHGLKMGASGLAWWTISLVALVGCMESLCMRSVNQHYELPKGTHDGPAGSSEKGVTPKDKVSFVTARR